MQVIAKNFLRWALLLFPSVLWAQSSELPQGHPYVHLLDRLAIKLQRRGELNLATIRPVTRKWAAQEALYADSVQRTTGNLLSRVDQRLLRSLLLDTKEWAGGRADSLLSAKPWGRSFFQNPANLLEVRQKDFFLAVNPVLQQQVSVESGNSSRLFLNTRGVVVRGLLANRIGFSTYLTDNQERGPRFFQDRVDSFQAVPGVGYYKPFKQTAYDYFDGRGSVYFSATRYAQLQFGYDKNFIGNGYRSLFLSDFSNSALFLKINTRIWKFNYLNLFMELTPPFRKATLVDEVLEKKYAAIHHLSVNVRPWLNVGLFDAVVFGRKDHFDFTYLNPVIFLRLAEQQNGSGDNAFLGFDVKAQVRKKAQLYGQFLIDEFFLKEVRARSGWWANKYAVQLGAKVVDVFAVPNLDLQAECNWVRPFTYAHFERFTNYSHYNQPLAHPLGANFREFIGLIRYQPHWRWTTSLRWITWKQGIDSLQAPSNVGSNMFFSTNTRSLGGYGYSIGSGVLQKGINIQWWNSWEWKHGLFLEAALWLRKVTKPKGVYAAADAQVFTIGLRWNMFRREYDY